jgi:poly-gamma-glutamate synthesis protein (capsule biosynthesis protein)
MLPHDSVVQQAKTPAGYDFAPYFSNINGLYKSADVMFCNGETVVAGQELGIAGYPAFNAPQEFARDVAGAARCNLVNMANNHIFDKGQRGIDVSRQVWESHGVVVNGANRSKQEQDTISYMTKNDLKVAFVAFADFSNQQGFAPFSINFYHDKALVEQLLTKARATADIVIVSAHWGDEDSTKVNPDQAAAAQLFSDLGADVVIGTGPHVLQKATMLKSKDGRDTFVWYSIGNMLNSQLAVNELTSIIPQFTVIPQKVGVRFKDIKVQATYMSYEWTQADRAAENLSTRHNLKLDTLNGAKDTIPAMFPGESVSTRAKYITDTLGHDVDVEIIR